MLDIRVIPAILSNSAEDMLEKIGRIERFVNRVQIDIVGKVFASDLSVGVEELEQITSSVILDVQLMVREPIKYLNRCDEVGVGRVFGHVEWMKNREEFIEQAFSLGMEVGLALDLLTPISAVEREIQELDAVLLMSVPAGRSGQEFDKGVLRKISKVRELRADIPICVDGGIDPINIGSCVEAGASEFAVGSYLWESRDVESSLQNLQDKVL